MAATAPAVGHQGWPECVVRHQLRPREGEDGVDPRKEQRSANVLPKWLCHLHVPLARPETGEITGRPGHVTFSFEDMKRRCVGGAEWGEDTQMTARSFWPCVSCGRGDTQSLP